MLIISKTTTDRNCSLCLVFVSTPILCFSDYFVVFLCCWLICSLFCTSGSCISKYLIVFQDMQFWMELLIESIFEVMRTLIHYSLSPFKTFKLFLCWMVFGKSNSGSDDLVNSSTLGDSNPALRKQVRRQQNLNMDERTCEDFIRDLG